MALLEKIIPDHSKKMAPLPGRTHFSLQFKLYNVPLAGEAKEGDMGWIGVHGYLAGADTSGEL